MTPEQQKLYDAGIEALKVLQQLPTIVLLFLVVIAFIILFYRTQSTSHVQAQTVNENTVRGIKAQEEANRLAAGLQVALNSIMALYTQSVTVMSGQAAAMDRQSSTLNTSLPALAATAQGTDAKVDLIVAAIKENGVDIRAVNLRLGYLAVDTKTIAEYLKNPTAENKQEVDDIANKPATADGMMPEIPATAAPATVEVSLPVTLVAPEASVTP